MINLKNIFQKISNVEQNDIHQDEKNGSTTIKLEDKAYEFVMRNLDSAKNDWINSIKKEKDQIIITTTWKTIFKRK